MSASAASGLVPSINNVKTVLQLVADQCLTVDHVVARCTRLRKNLGVAAKQLSKGAGQAFMLTFTYRDDVEWKPDHVRDALRHLRQWAKREHGWQLRYIWVMETQDRKSGERVGEYRPHYHCIVWVPREVVASDLFLDARGWWPHGFTNAVLAVAPVRYVMKYASKFENGSHFPKGARVYGVGGLDAVGRKCRRWINWPRFVQARASVDCSWRRAAGGGWTDGDGVIWASEWGVAAIGKGYTRVVRVRSYPAPLTPPDGPFSWLGAAREFVMEA